MSKEVQVCFRIPQATIAILGKPNKENGPSDQLLNVQANPSTALAACLKSTPEELVGDEPAPVKTEKRSTMTPARVCSNPERFPGRRQQSCPPLLPTIRNNGKITCISLNIQTPTLFGTGGLATVPALPWFQRRQALVSLLIPIWSWM